MILTSGTNLILRTGPEPFEPPDISSRLFCHDDIFQANASSSAGAVGTYPGRDAGSGGVFGDFSHLFVRGVFLRFSGNAYVARECARDADSAQKDRDHPTVRMGAALEFSDILQGEL